jgi:hypothetical protein
MRQFVIMNFREQAVHASMVQKQDVKDLGYDAEMQVLQARIAVLEVELKNVIEDG